MKKNYRIGDFVKLQQPENYTNSRIFKKDLNVFKILKLEDECVQLKHIAEVLPISAIAPIPVNGIDDKEIYYDPIIAGSIILPGDPIPVHYTNYTYYLDQLKKCIWGEKTFQEITSNEKFEYVHEIQHFLQDNFQHDDLKINVC